MTSLQAEFRFGLKSNNIRYCAVHNCNEFQISKSKLNIVFHKFPRDENLCHTWLVNCGRLDLLKSKNFFKIHNNYSLCSHHFNDAQYYNPKKRLRLLPSAVPTVFKDTSISEIGQEKKSCSFSKVVHNVQLKKDLQIQTVNSCKDVMIKNKLDMPTITSTDDVKPNIDFIKSEPQLDFEDCGDSGFCSHYISFIEEKAKNHKLNRKVEELEQKIRSMEEFNVNQNWPYIYVKPEVEEEEIGIRPL